MAVSVDALLSTAALDARVAGGHVRVRVHPTEPLAIANYTSRAAYERVWDEVTRRCRGLIWHTETREVLARPFAKFFDLHETTERLPGSRPIAHEKLDGSLGILYRHGDGWSVATRGSFDSAQAIWATEHLRRKYADLTVPEGMTPLVEILYPENRIVVDHGRRDLTLLGAIQIATGADIPLWEVDWWPGPIAEQHVVESAHDGYLLATSDVFAESEGLVLTWYRPGRPSLRAKVKHPRYVELHRIVTGSTERDVWRALVAADWRGRVAESAIARVLNVSSATVAALPLLADALAAVPPDFRAQLLAVESRLRAEHAAIVARTDELWTSRPKGSRRAFAEWASTTGHKQLLFRRLDDRPWQLDAWALCRPEAVPVAFSSNDDA